MPAIGIVTAIANPALEAVVIRGLAESGDEVQVVRRCVEVSDVLAVAASGRARAVVIGDNLAGLDADVVRQLAAYGVVPIALAEPHHRWPSAYAIDIVLDAAATPGDLADRIVTAARTGVRDLTLASADAASTPPEGAAPPVSTATARGTVIAVWGPTGAPGRSTVALGIADEAARLEHPTLLVDADPYGGAQAAMLGLLDESPGIAAACRAAAAGTLDAAGLNRISLQIAARLKLLTGISRADRWPELRPAAVETVIAQARASSAVTVIDCGFCIEEDEELTYDSLAPRRNAATTTALRLADEVVLVAAGDPVGVARAVRAAQDLRALLPSVTPRLVVNKVRPGVLDGDPAAQLDDAFARFTGLPVARLLPSDGKAVDTALRSGRALAEAAPGSALRRALTALTADLLPAAASASARPGRRRRARRGARTR